MKDKADVAQVASISANNDSEIGNLIADAMEKSAGRVITVERVPAWKWPRFRGRHARSTRYYPLFRDGH
jgi:hypothetical protein